MTEETGPNSVNVSISAITIATEADELLRLSGTKCIGGGYVV